MSDYATLEDMGIRSFDDVSHFTVRREQKADVLKVYYCRTKGSLLPKSKKFTFVRPRSAVPLQYRDQQGWEQFKGSSPRLQQAVKELTQLTKPEARAPQNLKVKVLDDLLHLEKVMQAKIDEIKRQVEALS
ncbi:MAG: DUF3461 family protein [Motiliproteus sp.]